FDGPEIVFGLEVGLPYINHLIKFQSRSVDIPTLNGLGQNVFCGLPSSDIPKPLAFKSQFDHSLLANDFSHATLCGRFTWVSGMVFPGFNHAIQTRPESYEIDIMINLLIGCRFNFIERFGVE